MNKMTKEQKILKPLSKRFFTARTPLLAQKLLGKILINSPTPVSNIHVATPQTLLSQRQVQLGLISEVEAYEEHDPASHSFKGQTPGNQTMFAAPGTWYVYPIYGLYYCANIVSERLGVGAAVLIRAVIPLYGLNLMSQRRHLPAKKHFSKHLTSPFMQRTSPLTKQFTQNQQHPHNHQVKQEVNKQEAKLTTSADMTPFLPTSADFTPAWHKMCSALTGGPGKFTTAFAMDKALNGKSLLSGTSPLALRSIPALRISPHTIVRTPRIGLSHSKEALLRFTLTPATKATLALRAYRLLRTVQN